MSDSLTLILDGNVTLDDFAQAVGEFRGLVSALTREVSGGAEIQWVVSALGSGSAVATVQGIGTPEAVETVVRAYETVGDALARSAPFPYSKRVYGPARKLVALIDGSIESVRFETDRRDALVRGMPSAERHRAGSSVSAGEVAASEDAYGAVEGMVETLARRGGLRFTLYDTVHDRAVSCYLSPGYETLMRDVWGRRAVVSGRVHRDPLTGRPLSIRQITNVQPVKEGARGDWRRARGVAPLPPGVSSVDAIRAVRDA